MIRRPPRSTLFPTRRSSDLIEDRPDQDAYEAMLDEEREIRRRFARKLGRSEEHTSELQSLAYLVCRLLLEKKKTVGGPHADCRLDSRGHLARRNRQQAVRVD